MRHISLWPEVTTFERSQRHYVSIVVCHSSLIPYFLVVIIGYVVSSVLPCFIIVILGVFWRFLGLICRIRITCGSEASGVKKPLAKCHRPKSKASVWQASGWLLIDSLENNVRWSSAVRDLNALRYAGVNPIQLNQSLVKIGNSMMPLVCDFTTTQETLRIHSEYMQKLSSVRKP